LIINIEPFNTKDESIWDKFCDESYQATFLHTRRYLSYHGARFIDQSVIIEQKGRWLGLLPAAQSPQDPTCIVTHPGITYGGVIHQGELQGALMITAIETIKRYFARLGYITLQYKSVPTFYHQVPAQDDLYALFRLGARRYRCDLGSAIDLQNRQPISQRRKRSLIRAIKSGIAVVNDIKNLPELWEVLEANLAKKHATHPVHTINEMVVLTKLFPSNIFCICGILNSTVVSGLVLFFTKTTCHAQYIGASQDGYDVSALDAVFDYAIKFAIDGGKRWFNFGISTESNGSLLNDGLYRFKTEFGGGGVAHEFFELDLREC